MRTSFIILALAAASQAARVPLCSAICMTNGIASTGCSASDTSCICGSDKFLPAVAECAESDCNGDSQALETAEGFCANAGLKTEVKRSLSGGHGPPEGFKNRGPGRGRGRGRWGGRWRGGRPGYWRGGKWGGRPGWWSAPGEDNSNNGGSPNNGGSSSGSRPTWGDWAPQQGGQQGGSNGGQDGHHGGWRGPGGPHRGGNSQHGGGNGGNGGNNNNGGGNGDNGEWNDWNNGGGNGNHNGGGNGNNGGWNDWQNHPPKPTTTGPWNPPHTVI